MLRVAQTLCDLGPLTSFHVEQLFVDGRLKVAEVIGNSVHSQTVLSCKHNRSIPFHVKMCFVLSGFAIMTPRSALAMLGKFQRQQKSAMNIRQVGTAR